MNHNLASDLKQIQSKISGLLGVVSLLIESSQNPTSGFGVDACRGVLELLAERLVDSADDLSILSESLEGCEDD